MANPITTTDIINISTIQGELKNFADAIKSSMSEVKSSIEEAAKALQGFSGGKGVSAQATEVEALTKKLKEQEQAVASLESQIAKLNATRKAKPSGDNDGLLASYASLQDLLERTKVDLDNLALSEKAHSQIAKQGQIANSSLGGSYNQLAAQYNLVKIALNSMTDSMRQSEKVGKVWEAEALRIMNAMKGMQEATGKHTLSVGDYGKAWKELNGLNIATQQVLREMPTIANSWSQFFIAISNNVPIFVDQFRAVVKATNSVKAALVGTLSAIFSWQTLLLGVLTVLPKVAKMIHEKKKATDEETKAQKENNKESKRTKETLQDLISMWVEIKQRMVSASTEVDTLTKVLNDNNRTLDTRITAGQRLKQIFKDELDGYSAEEIAAGKAAVKIEELTNKLIEQAKARGILDKITEYSTKIVELSTELETFGQSWTDAGERLTDFYQRVQEAKPSYLSARNAKLVNEYGSMLAEIKNYQTRIDNLVKEYNPFVEIEDTKGRGRSAKDKAEELGDYYRTMVSAFIEALPEGTEKKSTKAIFDSIFAVEDLQAEIEKVKQIGLEQGKDVSDQLTYLNNAIAFQMAERNKLLKQYNKEWLDELHSWRIKSEEENEAYVENWDAEQEVAFKNAVQALNLQYDTLDLQAIKDNKNRYNRKREQLQNEIQYWEDYKKLLIENMMWTTEREKEWNARQEALGQKYDETRPSSFLGYIGMWADEGWSQKFEQNLSNAFNTAFQYMEHWMDYRIQMADVAIESAEREREAAKEVLDYEREARANGYANNVELAKREYDEKLAIEQQAIKEKQKLQKIQEAIDTATQASSLITATANLWSSLAGIPAVGYILAAAATTAMFGSFLAAKVQAHKVAGATYGDGMSEYLDYGGSHASGNDIDFGRMKDGTPRRVERGEVIGVINKRNVRKYGANEVQNIINSLNKGTFEQKYGNAFADFSISNPTDISGISSDVKAIKEQGESKVYVTGGKTIKVYKNLTRVIR